jgi:hypothetical protein
MMSIGKSCFNFGLNLRATSNPLLIPLIGFCPTPNPNKIPFSPDKFLVAKTVYCENLAIEYLKYPKINLNCLRPPIPKIQFETELPNPSWVPGQSLHETPYRATQSLTFGRNSEGMHHCKNFPIGYGLIFGEIGCYYYEKLCRAQ